MPIKVNADLPAVSTLEKENIFVMTDKRAATQDIRPLKIAIVNLMPTKETTETQLLRLWETLLFRLKFRLSAWNITQAKIQMKLIWKNFIFPLTNFFLRSSMACW